MDKWLPLLNTLGLFVVSVVTYFGNKQTHNLVNSRMSEMLILAQKAGKSEEATEERERLKEKKDGS